MGTGCQKQRVLLANSVFCFVRIPIVLEMDKIIETLAQQKRIMPLLVSDCRALHYALTTIVVVPGEDLYILGKARNPLQRIPFCSR